MAICKCGKDAGWGNSVCEKCNTDFFIFGDKVKVISGFYMGQTGKVIDRQEPTEWLNEIYYKYKIQTEEVIFWTERNNIVLLERNKSVFNIK